MAVQARARGLQVRTLGEARRRAAGAVGMGPEGVAPLQALGRWLVQRLHGYSICDDELGVWDGCGPRSVFCRIVIRQVMRKTSLY